MRIEHQAGRAAALLSLIGLILAPGAAAAQQRDHSRVGSQTRVPVRMLMTPHSSIPVRVVDAPAMAPLPGDEDRVFITNRPGPPLVTSVPGSRRAVAAEPHEVADGASPGADTSWLDDDGVAWLPQQGGQWSAPSEQAIVARPQSSAAAELAGVNAYLSGSAGSATRAPTVVDSPPASIKPYRRLPTRASMYPTTVRQGQMTRGGTQLQSTQWAPSPPQPSAISYSSSGDFTRSGASLGGQTLSNSVLGGGDYLLGPGDKVDVFVWRNAELSRQVPVRPDGYISLPLVGELAAAGKTAAELEAEITILLSDFVQVPTVTVTVTDIKSLVIYVLGRVGTPGPVTLDRNINVLQAISMAGGPTEFANQNGITILRTIANQRTRIPYRYGDIMKGRADPGELVLQSGDVIYVP